MPFSCTGTSFCCWQGCDFSMCFFSNQESAIGIRSMEYILVSSSISVLFFWSRGGSLGFTKQSQEVHQPLRFHFLRFLHFGVIFCTETTVEDCCGLFNYILLNTVCVSPELYCAGYPLRWHTVWKIGIFSQAHQLVNRSTTLVQTEI